MKRDRAIQFLKALGSKVPGIQSRANWTLGSCPLGPWRHKDGESGPEKFGIRCEDGDSFCNCFSCGWHGTQSDLVLEMRQLNKHHFHAKYPFGDMMQLIAEAEDQAEVPGLDSPDIEEMLYGEKVGNHVFPEWWLDTFLPWHEAPFAIEYLKNRGVAQEVAEFMDLRVDTDQKRICFPVRNFKGQLMGLHGRAVDEGVEPRYRMYLNQGKNNPLIWLGEHWIDFEKPIIEVEGPFDIASVYRVYRNVASPLFSNPSLEKMKRMGDALEIITFLDNGTGGDVGRKKAETAFKASTVTHVVPPKGLKDPGSMNVQQIAEALHGIVPFDEIIS